MVIPQEHPLILVAVGAVLVLLVLMDQAPLEEMAETEPLLVLQALQLPTRVAAGVLQALHNMVLAAREAEEQERGQEADILP